MKIKHLSAVLSVFFLCTAAFASGCSSAEPSVSESDNRVNLETPGTTPKLGPYNDYFTGFGRAYDLNAAKANCSRDIASQAVHNKCSSYAVTPAMDCYYYDDYQCYCDGLGYHCAI